MISTLSDRIGIVVGGALIVSLTGLLVGDFWLHQGWLVWLWLVGSAAGFWLLGRGLNNRRQGLGTRTVSAALAVGVFLVIVVPYLTTVVLGSFVTRRDLLGETPHILPPNFTASWYQELWNTQGFQSALANSLLVATTTSISTTLFGLLGAYAIARLRFPGKGAIYNIIMISYMLPGIAIIIPLVFIFRWWGNSFDVQLIDRWYGIMLGHTAILLPFIVWLLVGTYEAVDPDVEHAARVDGASRMRVVWRVLVPMTAPSVVTVFVFAFILSWNELLVSKVLYISQTPMLAPLIVNLMDPINRVEPKVAAAGVIASVPVLVLAFLMQRYIVREIAAGSVK
jgi:multiple sugar transport system permease protein